MIFARIDILLSGGDDLSGQSPVFRKMSTNHKLNQKLANLASHFVYSCLYGLLIFCLLLGFGITLCMVGDSVLNSLHRDPIISGCITVVCYGIAVIANAILLLYLICNSITFIRELWRTLRKHFTFFSPAVSGHEHSVTQLFLQFGKRATGVIWLLAKSLLLFSLLGFSGWAAAAVSAKICAYAYQFELWQTMQCITVPFHIAEIIIFTFASLDFLALTVTVFLLAFNGKEAP